MIHDYTRKRGIVHSEILLPPNAPPDFRDRGTLWNSVEQIEKACNSQLARELEVALPIELSREEQVRLIRAYCSSQFVSRGMCADFNIHDTGSGNPHAHILLTMRPMDERGKWLPKSKKEYVLDENGERIRLSSGRYKNRKVDLVDWNSQENAEVWRKVWADLANEFLERNNRPERIDHRSYERQGVDQIPTVHEGPAVRQMEAKGIRTDKGDHNRFIRAANAMMKATRAKIKKLILWLKEINNGLSKPQEPTLADFLNRYYGQRNAGAWSQKAKLGNLKSHSEAVSYLQKNGIYTLADLEQKVQACGEQDRQMKAAMKQTDSRTKELNDLLQLAHFYAEGKPVYDKLNTIKFKKAREKFASEHERELHFFYLAQRKLKPHFNKDGKLPITRWKQEQEKLKAERVDLGQQYRPLADEVKKLWQIKFAVESAKHEIEQEQQPKRKHEQER